MKNKDLFADKSKNWDMNSNRVKNAKAISDLIVKNINLEKSMNVMDLGAGTGLLSYFIAPFVDKIVAVDSSPSMLKEFESKCDEFACRTEVKHIDIVQYDAPERYDGVISSMTIHHIEDTPALLNKLYNMVDDGGFIALADLDSEDGSFHSDNTGVFHYGFDRHKLAQYAAEAGFSDVTFSTASTIKKPHRDFTVFLMTAIK
ncbi:class I SAM-dependent methyltransferase [Sulfurovum sp. zt1-1]|uniref:Class I SAM-dependent methyltransferase n=1 Tax=Sulfurovum zhangzhouensis TaxID=3019067 RepID=A0ABT7QXP4_9BACT|nr:class I SAM-dependent methyltransferase [Sulfurovum zhangzhouensis]MDM5271546.1 class I SAM-dependent methyltransferase [Sulfurovum zhangzhouensis]